MPSEASRTSTTVLTLALGTALVLEAGEPRRLTLEECLRRAEASPAAKTLAAEVSRARAELRGAGLWPNPEVSLSREEAGEGRDEFATLSQPIPLSGRLGLEAAAARHGLEAAERRARQARVELRMQVRDAFFELLAAQERAAILESGHRRLGDLVRILEAREREGESSGFDRMRAERESAEVESDLFAARSRLHGAQTAIASLLEVRPGDILADGDLAAGAGLPALDDVRPLAASRGDLEALVAEAERSDRLAAAAGRQAVPEPAITAGVKRTALGSSAESGAFLGVSVTIPLFDRGQGDRAVARAEADLWRARHGAARIAALEAAEAALAEAARRREAARAYEAGADPGRLVRIAAAAYEEGEMGILELLDAHRTALAVRLKRVDLRAEARKAEAALNRAVGSEVVAAAPRGRSTSDSRPAS